MRSTVKVAVRRRRGPLPNYSRRLFTFTLGCAEWPITLLIVACTTRWATAPNAQFTLPTPRDRDETRHCRRVGVGRVNYALLQATSRRSQSRVRRKLVQISLQCLVNLWDAEFERCRPLAAKCRFVARANQSVNRNFYCS